jgi:outer membrane protein TolC
MIRKFFTVLLVFVLLTKRSAAQATTDSLFILPDSAYAFTIESFYSLIVQHHPLVKQVELLSEAARQEIRLARGNFDPKIEATLLQKNYKGTEYYNTFNAEIKIPVFFPIDPKIGIDRNSGAYLNPERYIGGESNYKQFYAGISLPLARGLVTDERRTAMRQAELFARSTEAEQIKMLNKILLDAAKDYWQWFYAYYNFRLYGKSVRLAENIYKSVKINCEYGELAPIDTIQAKITLQQRQIDQREALLDFQNTGIQLSNYLWDSLSNPIQLPLNWTPTDQPETILLTSATLNELLQQAQENHPELQKIRIKLQHLGYDQRLATEGLKPRINLNYNLINEPFNFDERLVAPSFNNYKFGLEMSYPIFTRKERAKLALTRMKINSAQYEERLTSVQIKNEIQLAYNNLLNSQGILQQQQSMADNYARLLSSEIINIENGESDLFKVNAQQEKLIQAQSKVLKLRTEIEKQKAMLYWAAGVRRFQGSPNR